MRKKIRGGISILVAAAMLLTGGGAGIAAGAEETAQAEAAQEATAVEAEPVETGDAGTEAGIAPIAFPNDIDPDAKVDEVLDDGIQELSTVDKSQFINEDDISYISTDFVPARFDTMVKDGGDAGKVFWDSRESGWVTGAGRYLWMQVDMADAVKKLLETPGCEDYNFVQANVNITARYNRTAGDTNKVQYIPDNSWTDDANEDAGGKALTYTSSLQYFDQGDYVGNGQIRGVQNGMKINTVPADGVSRHDVSVNDYRISLVVYGGGTGCDVCSSYQTEANNGGQPMVPGYQPSFQMVYSNANQQQIEYINDRPPALEKIRSIIDAYDNLDFAAGFIPIGDEDTTKVTYSIEDEATREWIEIQPDGKLELLKRPTAEEGNQQLKVRVTAQRHNVIFTYVLTLYAMAEQGISPMAEQNLRNVIQFSEQTLEEQKDNIVTGDGDTTPGRLSDQLKAELEELIATAKDSLAAGETAKYSAQTQMLLSKGQEFMSSGVISNEILYHTKNKYLDEGNTLVYSDYRAKLQGLVWRAKATLLVDEELYSITAKRALQSEIDRAELALGVDEDGTSMLKLPFTKTRMFYARPDDYMIQNATSYYLIHDTYSQMGYGLEPVMEWYSRENILYNAYSTMELEAKYAGYIRQNQPTGFTYGGNVVIGSTPSDRIGIFQFDLSSIVGSVLSARVRLQAVNTNAHQSYVYLEQDYEPSEVSWNRLVQDNGPYDRTEEIYGHGVVSGKQIGGYRPAGTNTDSFADITDAVAGEVAGDGVITFSIQKAIEVNNANEVYGTNAIAGRRPVLIVKTSDVSMSSLKNTVNTLIDNQKGLFEDAGTYSGDVRNANVGEYEKTKYDALVAAQKRVESLMENNANVYEVAQAGVDYLDAAYNCRMSIALLSDIDVDEDGKQKGNIFFTGEEVEELRENIKTNDNLKNAYLTVKDSMATHGLEVAKDYWERWKANDRSLWVDNPSFISPPASTGGKYYTGRTIKDPNGSTKWPLNLANYSGKAYITIELEPQDNDTTGYSDLEGTGCGEAWVDNLAITADSGATVELPNASFETRAITENAPLNWTLTTTGNGEGKWESDRRNVSSGNRSLYLHNPDGNSSVKWTSSVFDLPADGYDITWNVQQYGIFEDKGAQIKFHFLTNSGTEVVSRENFDNGKAKPTVTGIGTYTTTMTQAAIMAMLADNDADREKYAETSKIYMYLYLDEINQGAEHWLATNSRPDGIDAMGSVQAGRGASSLATAYSIVKNMKDAEGNPIISDEERAELTTQATYLMRDLCDLRDRYELDNDAANRDGSNWISDACMGAAMLGLAFEDTMENARMQLFNGMRINNAQLTVNMLPDGAWPESIRYHNAVFSKLAVLAKCLRASSGFDWFGDPDLNFYKAFEYLTWIQTPRYSSGNASTPFFGDHNLSAGDELYMCGLYYDEVAASHPDIALRMYGTWVNAGTPAPSLSGDDNQIQAFFGHGVDINDYGDYREAMKEIGSTNYARYIGIFVMRNNFMVKGKESYLAFMNHNRGGIGHGHNDMLSFIMYADNVPLVVDPGAPPSYWAGAKGNYTGNTQHSLIAYANNESGTSYEDTVTTSTQRGWYTSDSLDVVKGSATNRSGSGEIMRDIAFIKNGFEAYVIHDQITGATYGTMMNLPLYTKSKNAITRNGNKFTAKMFGGIDLEVTYLKGNYENYEVVTLNANGTYQLREDETLPVIDHLRIRNQGNDPYLTVLFPKTGRRGSLTTEDLGDGVYRLSHSSGNTVYVAVNEDAAAKKVTIPAQNLIDLESLNDETPTVYADGVVTVPKNSMKLLTTKVTTTQETDEAGSGTPAQTPEPSRQGGTTGSATPGAAAGGGAAAPSNDPTNYVTGNNVNSDLTKPGVAGKPSADINDSKAAKGKLAFDVTGDADVYYSVNGSDYKKYSGTDNSLSEGRNTVVYFTVDRSTGGKTRGISEVITVGVSSGNGDDTILEDADTAVEVYRNLAVGQKAKISAASGVEVEYRSADSAVASVTGKGVVTAKKAGKTDISVLVTKDGVTEKVLIHVTVKKKKNVPEGTRNLGKVKVTKAGTPVIVLTKEMEVSGSSKIVVEKKEGVTLSYKTSDKAIATVTQSGKIKGKSTGTANVTATVKMNGVVQKYQVKVTVK